MRDTDDFVRTATRDILAVTMMGERQEKDLVERIERMNLSGTGEAADIMTTALGTDWARIRDILGDTALKIGFGVMASLKGDDMFSFKLVSRLIIRPLLEKYDAAMRMVETLTVSKEIGEAKEERQ